MEHIPLVDLKAQHAAVADEVAAGFASVLERTAFVLGEEVDAFEREFAAFSGAAHCVGVGNGTDAVELALRAAGIARGRRGDPSGQHVHRDRRGGRARRREAGARRLRSGVPAHRRRRGRGRWSTRRTAAVVPVHLFGQIAPLEPLQGAARFVGPADHRGRRAVPGGDAGTAPGRRRRGRGRDELLPGQEPRCLRRSGRGAHRATPTSHADSAASATTGAKPSTSTPSSGSTRASTRSRPSCCGRSWPASPPGTRPGASRSSSLRRRCSPTSTASRPRPRSPATSTSGTSTWSACRVATRSSRRCTTRGSVPGVHYPIPVHLQGAFRSLGHQPGDFPEAERAAAEILSLPLFPEITAGAAAARRRRAREGPGVSAEPACSCTSRACARATTSGPGRGSGRSPTSCPEQSSAPTATSATTRSSRPVRAIGDRVTVKNAVLIWDRVTVDDDVFLGPNMVFTNDLMPRAAVKKGTEGFLADPRATRRDDRCERDHRVRRDDRGAGVRRRGRGRHPRRRPARARRRQPGAPNRLGVRVRHPARRRPRVCRLRPAPTATAEAACSPTETASGGGGRVAVGAATATEQLRQRAELAE